jgi:uncharacterized protein (TIGR02270 family)
MTAAAPRLTYIPDLVEEHFDELQFLWTHRRAALRSPSYTERRLAALEDRIEGHAQGMTVIGDRLVVFVQAALLGDEELPAFGAAFALLRLGTPDALAQVANALAEAHGPRLDGLADALANGLAKPLTPQLTSLFLSGSPPVAAAAGLALAFHGVVTPVAQHLERILRADGPATRAAGWRTAGYCGVSIPNEWYHAGLSDDDSSVKRAAREAAAWNSSPVFLPHCRTLAANPTPETIDAIVTFAAVASPEDYRLIGFVASNSAGGPDRFRIVSSFGHPYFVELLIQEMSNPDPAAAVAAGVAFSKMTGRDVESNQRAKVSADGKPPADDFEAEFQDEVFLPDPDLARKHWQELAPALSRSPRICRGMDVSQPLSREQFAALDMESRWEYCLRMRLFSGWQGTPLVLERYPQRF